VRCFLDFADTDPFSILPFLFTPFHLYCCIFLFLVFLRFLAW
jgi:hypothetical protein